MRQNLKLARSPIPDPKIRRQAIELTKRGIDAGREFGASTMTLWMGQDGFDYCFQADYKKIWEDAVSAVREMAEYAPDIDISIEYKPNEPRAFSIFPNVTTCLIAVEEAGCQNLGITLDFAHVLFANEIPAFAAAMVSRRSRLLGLDLQRRLGQTRRWSDGGLGQPTCDAGIPVADEA